MAAPFGRFSFAAGELAPALWGHVDFSKYAIGLSTCRNAFIDIRGAAYSRAGTAFVGYSRQVTNGTLPPRLLPFQFNLQQGICIEAGNFYFRFIIDGGFVLEAGQSIVGITQANPGVFNVPAHGYFTGDWVFPTGIGGMTALNGRQFVVQFIDANHFSLKDVFGNVINTTAVPVYTGGGIVARIYTLTTPWSEVDIKWLKFTQSADVMTLCCWNQDTNAALFSTGNVTFVSNPSPGDTVTLNGVVFTFVASGATGNQVNILGTLALTLAEFAGQLIASTNPAIDVANYGAIPAGAANMISITYKTEGINGNTYTLAASAATPSASALYGGNISYPPFDLERVADDDWTLTQFSAASSKVPPTNVTLTASNATGSTQYEAVVTTVDRVTGEESVASSIASVSGSVDIAVVAGSLTVAWTQADGNNYYNVYLAPPGTGHAPVPPGSLFGFDGNAFGASFVDTNTTPDFNQSPPLHEDPFAPGQIEFVTITSGGTGLSTVSFTINTQTGSGFAGQTVVVNGTLVGFIVNNHGMNYLPGDSISFNGAGFATGAIVFSVNPSNGDTITLNGVVWTFVTSGAAGNQTNIQGTLNGTLTQLTTDLTASVNPSLTVASYTAEPPSAATSLTVTFNVAGTAGNAYTLAASVAVPSGPHLTGGGGSGMLSGILTVGPSVGTYPSVPAYFQERRFYGSTPNQPDTYFASQPGAFNNFDSRIPTIDSDAIIGTPWTVQVNGLQSLIPEPGGLVVFTGRQAWQIGGPGSSVLQPQPITPANQQAQAQAFNGCSNYFPPIKKDYDIYYLQALGNIIRDFSYNLYVGIYTGTDITYLSSHLFQLVPIREGAYCEEPFKIIWVVRNDGLRLSCTEFKEQEIRAWARHDTQGLTWSIAAIDEPPVDALYLATERTIGGNHSFMIERQDDRNWNGVESVWAVDAGLNLTQPEPAANITISSPDGLLGVQAVNNFQGGSNYIGPVTATIVDPTGQGSGATFGPVPVANGVCSIPAIVTPGAGYSSQAYMLMTDAGGSGTGAGGQIVLNTHALIIASAPIFSAGNLGSVLRCLNGRGTVSSFNSSTSINILITEPFQSADPTQISIPVSQGNWTLTVPTGTVVASHLAGAIVTGLADGSVITPRLAATDGTITLDMPASQIVVGLGFQVQLQTLRFETGNPTVQGQRKTIGGVTARVEASLGFEIGVNQPDGSAQQPMQIAPFWPGMSPAPPPMPPIGQAALNSSTQPLYTDDIRIDQASGWDKHGQVALQQNLPLPLQLLAVIPEFLPGDTPDVAVSPRAPGTVAPATAQLPY